MSATYEDRALYQGDVWVRIDTLPRIMAEGWRRNLMEGGVVSVVRTPFQWSMGSPVIEIETGGYQGDVGLYVPEVQLAEALELLGRVGMAEQADRPSSVLAYGDLKRLELAMALANEPRLLLMDEPTAGMAPRERVELMALTADLVRERGIAVLFTEHDMDVVFAHAHRIVVMNRGAIIADGTPDAVRNDPHVQEVYLGSGAMFHGEAQGKAVVS